MPRAAHISDITEALAGLIKNDVERIAAGLVDPFTVSRLPPEKAEEIGDTRLNIHLYHVSQDNSGGPDLPIGGTGRNPIATRPMPVKLFYVLTAHAMIGETVDDVASQHMLMGWALKALHDHGEIFADTVVNGVAIFDPDVALGERGVEIIIRPMEPEDSVSFWSTDQVRTARLAAFIEVRTLLLPPEPRSDAQGIVADFALGVFGSMAPRLTRSESVMEFTPPAALGGGSSRKVARSPAVAVLRSAAGSADALVRISGTGLGDGHDARLVLRGGGLAAPAVLAAAANPDWNIDIFGDVLSFEMRPAAAAESGPVTLLPGLYSISLRRDRELSTESGTIRRVPVESNRVPVGLAPLISDAQKIAGDHIAVDLDASVDVSTPGLEAQIGIAGDLYHQVDALTGVPADDAGNFAVRNANSYEAVPPAGVTHPAGTYPVRLTIAGIDAPPYWMEVA